MSFYWFFEEVMDLADQSVIQQTAYRGQSIQSELLEKPLEEFASSEVVELLILWIIGCSIFY